MDRFKKMEQTVGAVAAQLSRLEPAAGAFFAEQDARLKHVEKLVTMLAEKGGATAEELAAVAEAVKGLSESRKALSDAVNRSGILEGA